MLHAIGGHFKVILWWMLNSEHLLCIMTATTMMATTMMATNHDGDHDGYSNENVKN